MKFPVPMESWKYLNPEAIGDSLIISSRRTEAAENKRLEVTLRQNRRRIKALTRKAKKGGFRNVP